MFGRRFGKENFKRFINFEAAMTGRAIEAVQLHMFRKRGQADEAFEGGFPHLSDILEFHVICNEGQNLRRVFIGKAQALADCGGHFHANLDVSIEAYAISRD